MQTVLEILLFGLKYHCRGQFKEEGLNKILLAFTVWGPREDSFFLCCTKSFVKTKHFKETVKTFLSM